MIRVAHARGDEFELICEGNNLSKREIEGLMNELDLAVVIRDQTAGKQFSADAPDAVHQAVAITSATKSPGIVDKGALTFSDVLRRQPTAEATDAAVTQAIKPPRKLN